MYFLVGRQDRDPVRLAKVYGKHCTDVATNALCRKGSLALYSKEQGLRAIFFKVGEMAVSACKII